MRKPTIGWIGLGKMGIPMSLQLLKAGYPVTVYNRNKEKEQVFRSSGAVVAASPSLLITMSDIVILMVSDDQATRDIFTGKDGLMGADTANKIIINMSTVSPAVSKEMAALCKTKSHHYMDAPVSGSVKQATDGQLVVMAGGEAAIFEQVKPVLETMGKMAMLVGTTGAGNTAKLAINSLLAIYAQGLAETVLFAKEHAIDTGDLLTLLNNGALGNIFTKIKGDAILQDNYEAAFMLKHIVKDLGLARDEGLKAPLGEAAFQTFQKASPDYGEEDIIAVIKQLQVTK